MLVAIDLAPLSSFSLPEVKDLAAGNFIVQQPYTDKEGHQNDHVS
jgi:hypothetical protein